MKNVSGIVPSFESTQVYIPGYTLLISILDKPVESTILYQQKPLPDFCASYIHFIKNSLMTTSELRDSALYNRDRKLYKIQ